MNFQQDYNFVECYGAFKRFIDFTSIRLDKYLQSIETDVILTFYHFEYTHRSVSRLPANDVLGTVLSTSDYKTLTKDTWSRINLTLEAQQQSDILIRSKYSCNFRKFIYEWRSTEPTVIIMGVHLLLSNCSSMDAKSFPVPYIGHFTSLEEPRVPGSVLDTDVVSCNLLRSLQRNTNDVRRHGFTDVIIYDRDLEKLLTWTAAQDCEILMGTRTVLNDGSDYVIQINLFTDFDGVQRLLGQNCQAKNGSRILDHLHDVGAIFGIALNTSTINLDDDKVTKREFLRTVNAWNNRTRIACHKRLAFADADSGKLVSIDARGPIHTIESLLVTHNNLSLCDEFVLGTIFITVTPSNNNMDWRPVYMEPVVKQLMEWFLLAQGIIKTRWPNKTVRLDHKFIYDPSEAVDFSMNVYDSLYCNSVAASIFEQYEMFYVWAQLHDILIISRYVGIYSPIYWRKVEADTSVVHGLKNEFPLYIQKGFNESKSFESWAVGMHPCLKWELEVSNEVIRFIYSEVGTYLHFNLRSHKASECGVSEISTLLLFAMVEFTIVEVEIRRVTEMALLSSALTATALQNNLMYNSVKGNKLFINIPMDLITNSTNFLEDSGIYLTSVSTLPSDVAQLHIHFRLPNIFSATMDDLMNTLETFIKTVGHASHIIDVGIETDNCIEIVKILANHMIDPSTGKQNPHIKKAVKALKKSIPYKLLLRASYAVCLIPAKQRQDESTHEMQKYLETHIYIKTVLQVYFPNLKQVYFKLLPSPYATNYRETKEFLILVNQISKFSRGYGVPYFVVPAVAEENSNEIAWWVVSNYSNLSDHEMYYDVQRKYLQKDPWRPVLDNHSSSYNNHNQPAPRSHIIFIYGLIIVVTILVLVLSGVVVRARANAKLLSNQEVQEFIDGIAADSEVNNLRNRHLGKAYDQTFEICKSEIYLDRRNVLGFGNYGVVYKATLNSDPNNLKDVAVKTPRKGCDKTAFVAMLHEVKLLCTPGSHINLVGFLGCYTKEIKHGALYIVMELCSGGSLLSHLRQLKSTISLTANSVVTSLDLARLCQEIAAGMEYISNNGIVHGDLSVRNVLLDEFKICKISDFGLSRRLYEQKIYQKKTDQAIPWRWMSHESLTRMEYSTKSDVWIFGIAAWEIFSLGEIPYPERCWTSEFISELEQGMRLSAPEYSTPEMFAKLTECWSIVPENRPNFDQLANFFARFLPYAEMT